MKKTLLTGLATGLLLVGMVGTASAIPFEDEYKPDVELGKGTNPNSGIYDWAHNTPSDFEVPWDTVVSAFLTLKIDKLGDGTNYAEAITETINLGSVETWDQTGNKYTTDIGDVFTTWSNGDLLSVSLAWSTPDTSKPNGDPVNNYIKLKESTFKLEYTNGSAPAPVPEPATMLLFGTGLTGLVAARRKKKA